MKLKLFIISFILGVYSLCTLAQEMCVDYRYAPDWHQSTPALPEDTYKTLVGPQGQLLYDFGGNRFFTYTTGLGFKTIIQMMADENQCFKKQTLYSSKVPIPITESTYLGMDITQAVYSSTKSIHNGTPIVHPLISDREDILLTTINNTSGVRRTISPLIVINSDYDVKVDDGIVTIGDNKHFYFSLPVVRVRKNLGAFKTVIELSPVSIDSGQQYILAGIYDNGLVSELSVNLKTDPQTTLANLPSMCKNIISYWENKSNIPYGHILVPDNEIQNLIDASIRGIWQAREIVDGNISLQVGPTIYRGLWIVDGAFLAETTALLGRGIEARKGIEYALSFQKPSGEFSKLKEHFWKENGIILWTCVRHAMLTQDKDWLQSVWPTLCKTVDFIKELRARSYENNIKLDDGLIPPGFIDGGLNGGDDQPEYSNTLWNLAGLKCMIQAASWLGKKEDAKKWQAEYNDFYNTFKKAAMRDIALDDYGNHYLNNMMDPKHRSLPQRALWAFCQSIYPGQIFEGTDSIALGTLKMLHTTLQEGMVMGTGWIMEGIWNYFASFYGHACLWMGEPERAVAALYAFANHASPLYMWREEHNPRDLQRSFIGDMPHNWASAEFVRLVVHLLQIDRGNELHLLEGIPHEWLKAGMKTSLRNIATPFGELTFDLEVDPNGDFAVLKIDPLSDKSCKKMIVHTTGWGNVDGKSTINLNPFRCNQLKIRLKRN